MIIGQQWALDGLYTLLERRDNTLAYQTLTAARGRFTLEELGPLGWNSRPGWRGYSHDEQELLLSFMERCGLCFKLRPGAEAWRERDVYVSFEHLPRGAEAEFRRLFERRRPGPNPTTQLDKDKSRGAAAPSGEAGRATWAEEFDKLHKHHWQSFLYAAGAYYGKDAQYALDAFYVENKERERLLVACELASSGLGGRIEIQVAGPNAEERLKSAREYLERFLPGREARQSVSPAESFGEREAKVEVFISYAWEPRPADDDSDGIDGNDVECNDGGGRTGIPAGYEEPVDAIEEFLLDKQVIESWHRDKTSMQRGDSIAKFMEHGASLPHVIVVHSDRWWKSPYCMHELLLVQESIESNKERTWKDVVIPVEHLNSGITDRATMEKYLKFWGKFDEYKLPSSVARIPTHFRTEVAALVTKFHKFLNDSVSQNLKWPNPKVAPDRRPAKIKKVLTEIAKRLNVG